MQSQKPLAAPPAQKPLTQQAPQKPPAVQLPQKAQAPQQISEKAHPVKPPTRLDVIRYRYHHGVNLGSCFVLEKWLTPSCFPQNSNSSELAAVTTSVAQCGVSKTREKWEKHWPSIVSDADLDWLVNVARCTSIRLPIGYFTLGSKFVHDTPFKDAGDVYAKAWVAVKALIARAYSRGIGTLIDFHALPGGANPADHSGTNSGKVELWGSTSNLQLATSCLVFVAGEIKSMEGVIGLQICNEAQTNAPGMYEWFSTTINAISKVDPTIPIYISDGWNLLKALKYAQGKDLPSSDGNPILVDTHLYWTLSETDKAKACRDIIAEIPTKLSELDKEKGDVARHGAAQAIVGEYSCALDEKTWQRSIGRHDPCPEKTQCAMTFGNAQSKRYQQSTGGAYFWTWKMDWMDGGEWGFVQQVKNKAIIPPAWFSMATKTVGASLIRAPRAKEERHAKALAAHIDYWKHQTVAQTYEHWRFGSGFDQGYADAVAFFGMRSEGQLGKNREGADKIGCLEVWIRKRTVEAGMVGPYAWEFEAGFRQGVQGFYEEAGV